MLSKGCSTKLLGLQYAKGTQTLGSMPPPPPLDSPTARVGRPRPLLSTVLKTTSLGSSHERKRAQQHNDQTYYIRARTSLIQTVSQRLQSQMAGRLKLSFL